MLQTAIVGLGNVATWHRRGIDWTAGATLTAVADVDELLAAEPLDWIHICTPLATRP